VAAAAAAVWRRQQQQQQLTMPMYVFYAQNDKVTYISY